MSTAEQQLLDDRNNASLKFAQEVIAQLPGTNAKLRTIKSANNRGDLQTISIYSRTYGTFYMQLDLHGYNWSSNLVVDYYLSRARCANFDLFLCNMHVSILPNTVWKLADRFKSFLDDPWPIIANHCSKKGRIEWITKILDSIKTRKEFIGMLPKIVKSQDKKIGHVGLCRKAAERLGIKNFDQLHRQIKAAILLTS